MFESCWAHHSTRIASHATESNALPALSVVEGSERSESKGTSRGKPRGCNRMPAIHHHSPSISHPTMTSSSSCGSFTFFAARMVRCTSAKHMTSQLA